MLTRYAWRHRLSITLCVLLTAALLSACGGGGDAPELGSAGEQPAVLPALPVPSEVPRAASAPPADNDRYRDGLNYDHQLPHHRVSGMLDLELMPDWDPGDGPSRFARRTRRDRHPSRRSVA